MRRSASCALRSSATSSTTKFVAGVGVWATLPKTSKLLCHPVGDARWLGQMVAARTKLPLLDLR
jgi:hypothetical protein